MYVYYEKARKKVFDMNSEISETIEAGPVTKWIERYYQEKLDKRPGRNGPTASLLEQMYSLN